MKDPAKAIRTAYFNLIDGNITYNSEVVPIYDEFVPVEATYPHIVFSTQTFFQRTVKNCYITDATILLEVVSRDYKGKAQVDDVAAQLVPILVAGNLDVSPDFHCDYSELQSNESVNIEGPEGIGYVIRQITVRNLIQQV